MLAWNAGIESTPVSLSAAWNRLGGLAVPLIPLRTRLRPFCLLLAATVAVLLAGCAGEARPTATEFTAAAEETLMEH